MVRNQYRILCLVDNCEKSYTKSTKSSNMHVHKKASFKCSKCDVMFKRQIDRKRHEAIHCNLRYKCEKCWKRFVRENSLKLHNRKRPNCDKDSANFICFVCHMCQRSYVFKTSLHKHKKSNPNCGNQNFNTMAAMEGL